MTFNPRVTIGGNYGPQLDDAAPPVQMRIMRLHINDWVASTRGMTLEEEAFFLRFNLRCYDQMGPLIDDDRRNSLAMGLHITTYRTLERRLIELGKIGIDHGGRLSHPRAIREIEIYLAEYKRRSQAQTVRREVERSWADTANANETETEPETDRNRTGNGSKPDRNRCSSNDVFSKNANEIKGCTAPTGHNPSRARARVS
jgi:hypothetical protein